MNPYKAEPIKGSSLLTSSNPDMLLLHWILLAAPAKTGTAAVLPVRNLSGSSSCHFPLSWMMKEFRKTGPDQTTASGNRLAAFRVSCARNCYSEGGTGRHWLHWERPRFKPVQVSEGRLGMSEVWRRAGGRTSAPHERL